ncbi:hypothetical protein QFC21_007292 [Naganishia friedmannii]|uniref:Uncharacterized protein n=1 Tax=Naganishia friedmannii TaxID=89922 RepID=A0ACC2UWX3_9TREE|nr:hypothetical protein QFC21_007292 [Naganishia friedmannii]
MPSFAKKSNSESKVEQVRMADTFESGSAGEVLESFKQEARSRAKAILQNELPEYIRHIADLLKQAQDDEASPLWKGHLKSGTFDKENIHLKAPIRLAEDGPATSATNGGHGQEVSKTCTFKGEGTRNGSTRLKESDIPMGRCWQHSTPPNDVCDRLMDLLQVEGEKGLALALVLQRWLRLEVPTIEDGGNFGVGVQSQAMAHIKQFWSSTNNIRRYGEDSYYPNRAKLETSWCEYPNIENFAAAIATMDRSFFAGARIELETLISQSLYMLNVIRNNWVKVHDPKNKGDKEQANVLY